MDDRVTVSEKAWRMQGSKMFIKVGERVKVEDLLKGIAISSEICLHCLAEHVTGSEEAFVSKMNEKANLIDMKNSQFKKFPWDACGGAIHHSDGHGHPSAALHRGPS